LLFKFWTLSVVEPPPPPWGLRDNVRSSSLAHWKARSGLPISVNWTFFARCYGWGATSEYLFKIGDFAPTGARWPQISEWRGRTTPTILLLRKLG